MKNWWRCCALIAVLNTSSFSVAQPIPDEAQVASALQDCSAEQCLNFAKRTDDEKTFELAAISTRFFIRACELGDGLSCRHAGWHHERGVGTEVRRDLALYNFIIACELEFKPACDEATRFWEVLRAEEQNEMWTSLSPEERRQRLDLVRTAD